MLRELLDISLLEDFVRGLSRSAGLSIATFDSRGHLITASEAQSDFARATGWRLDQLPLPLRLVPVPAHDPPGAVAYVGHQGLWHIAAPVYVDDRLAGYVSLGEFREHSPSGQDWQNAQQATLLDLNQLIPLWEQVPALDRGGQTRAVVTARWGARLLADLCRRETRLISAAEEISLVGDIAELLTGQTELHRILDRIVAETARVMRCRFCSLRLFDQQTQELRTVSVYNLSQRYLNKGRLLRQDSPIDDEALRGNIVYVENAASDPRIQYPEEAAEEGIVSMLTAGMIYRGNPVGVIRVYTDRKQRFRAAQRNLLRAVGYQAATAIVHAQLVEERLRAAETDRQLALAAQLQKRMVAQPPREHPAVEAAVIFQPSYRVGGDFCDFLTLADGRLAAIVADVVGKGIPASLMMATVRGALRALAESTTDLGELLTRLNRFVSRETTSSEFVTLAIVAIDRDGRRLTYASAGHEPPLLLRAGTVHTLDEGGAVLGLGSQECYVEYARPAQPGDVLLLCTDGLVEAADFSGAHFGREQLHNRLANYGGLSADQVVRSLMWDVRRFVGLAEQSDDLTLVALRLR